MADTDPFQSTARRPNVDGPYLLEEVQLAARAPKDLRDWNELKKRKYGYQPAAGLLNWLEARKPGLVVKLNAAMREGTYTPELFNELAGGDPDELWEQFKTSLRETPEKAK